MKGHLIAVPTKGTARYDELVQIGITATINELFAADVINGVTIYNIETEEFCSVEKADDEFRAEAIAALARFLMERSR